MLREVKVTQSPASREGIDEGEEVVWGWGAGQGHSMKEPHTRKECVEMQFEKGGSLAGVEEGGQRVAGHETRDLGEGQGTRAPGTQGSHSCVQ